MHNAKLTSQPLMKNEQNSPAVAGPVEGMYMKKDIKSCEICSLETSELYRQQQSAKLMQSLTDKSREFLRIMATFFKS